MSAWQVEKKTALLLTDSGETFYGYGVGATGTTVAEVCFNTAMTGYQEILTDPSYLGQIVTFTFPHIGNVGWNSEDTETSNAQHPRGAQGLIIRQPITSPANYRAQGHLNDWLVQNQLIGISGIDTRAVTSHIRDHGMFNAILAHDPDGNFDMDALKAKFAEFEGLEGADLAAQVSSQQSYDWQEGRWQWEDGFSNSDAAHHVVALDYGVKKNILRCLSQAGCRVSVISADSSYDDVMALEPDGIFLSN